MPLSRQPALLRRVIAFLILSTASGAGAQTAINRWSALGTFDIGGSPNDFANQCPYATSAGVVGGGLGVFYRPRPGWVVASDVRAGSIPYATGCKAIIPGPIQTGPNEWENWAHRTYPSGVAELPLARTAVHIGREVTPGSVLLRAMAGGGVIWSGDPTPFASLAVGGGSARPGTRFVWELGVSIARLRVREEHTRYRVESNGMQTSLSPRVESYTAYPRWTMLRLGLEVPFVVGS